MAYVWGMVTATNAPPSVYDFETKGRGMTPIAGQRSTNIMHIQLLGIKTRTHIDHVTKSLKETWLSLDFSALKCNFPSSHRHHGSKRLVLSGCATSVAGICGESQDGLDFRGLEATAGNIRYY